MFIGIGIGLGMTLGGPGNVIARPSIVVTGGTITPFSRGGVDYIEVLFAQSGSFTLSAPIEGRYALAAGGANGGQYNLNFVPGGGGAGGLVRSAPVAALAQGSYGVNIGAGAPANAVFGGGADGSSSTLQTPAGTITAMGGGRGASAGTGAAAGQPGGSGGGGRGPSNTPAPTTPGTGTEGQGHSGGAGIGDANSADLMRRSGGGGGAGGAGGNASPGVAGAAGAGFLLDWIATPRTVCQGGEGSTPNDTGNTPNRSWGSGSKGAILATAGKGGDGFMVLVIRADQAEVIAA